MLGSELAYQILSEAVQYSPADETEIILRGGKLFASRFANNYIYQNGVQKDYSLTIRVAFGNKVGTASCNIFDGENLRKAVDNACTIARHSQPDREWVSIPEPQKYPDFPQSYFMETINFSPADKASKLAPVFEDCRKRNLIAAGMLTNGDGMVAVMNSRELFTYHNYTTSSFTFTARTHDNHGSGWAEYHTPDVREMEVGALAHHAMEKAEKSKDPQPLEPGEYTVVLEQPAVVSLIEFLIYLGFGGQAYQEGRSFSTGNLGKKLFSDRITLIDDASHHAILGLPFDYEGNAKRPLPLIERGILQNVAHDRRSARLCETFSTGHALMPPALYGALPTHVVLSPGDQTLDEMIASTERGIYITRFWYDNVVDEKQAITTGMSRDGTFLIENGCLTKPLQNLRYNQSLLKAFSNVEAVGNILQGFNSYFGKIATPALKLNGFHFTGTSHE